ncbi:MAG: trimethylamine methyltransferase family protein [Candidatus Moduliflexus flocculans]|nr:trimethylamine methyltransferase family protein [Candidatus Moduliflexus flocculans]
MGALVAALAGANIISGPGMLDFESCQSLEKLVFDNEICGMALRMVRGIEARGTGWPAISTGTSTRGPFPDFGGDAAVVPARRSIRTGPVVDRDAYDNWVHRGKKSAWDRACLEVAEDLELPHRGTAGGRPAHGPDGRRERRCPANGHRSASFGLTTQALGPKDVNMNAFRRMGFALLGAVLAGLRGLRDGGLDRIPAGPGPDRALREGLLRSPSLGPAERPLGLAQRLRRPGSADPRARGVEGQGAGRGHHLGRRQPRPIRTRSSRPGPPSSARNPWPAFRTPSTRRAASASSSACSPRAAGTRAGRGSSPRTPAGSCSAARSRSKAPAASGRRSRSRRA